MDAMSVDTSRERIVDRVTSRHNYMNKKPERARCP